MGNTKAAGRAAGQAQRDTMIGNLQAGFFDYAAMIAEREPKKAAASLMMLNSALDLIRGGDNASMEFVKALLEDIHTMIEIVEEETKINVQEMKHGKGAVTE